MKQSKRHKDSLRRIKDKWSHIRECRMLVEWHLEYKAEDERERRLRQTAIRIALRKKYDRLCAEMTKHFSDDCVSNHNRNAVNKYGYMWCKNRL